MSDELENNHGNPEAPASAEPVEVVRTGNPAVDAVLDSLDSLEDAPVSEHVPVFEAAHERLRATLADAGNDPHRP